MQVQTKAVVKAIALLRAAGASYTVTAPGGKMFTNIEPPKKPRRKPVGEHASFADYFRSHKVDELPVGGTVVVPYVDKVAKERLRSNLATFAHVKWGTGAALTALNGQGVELLRVK